MQRLHNKLLLAFTFFGYVAGAEPGKDTTFVWSNVLKESKQRELESIDAFSESCGSNPLYDFINEKSIQGAYCDEKKPNDIGEADELVPLFSDGLEMKPGAFPSFAFVDLVLKGGKGVAVCGGTLISRDLVLTAAHCNIPNIDYIRVTVGIANRSDELHRQESISYFVCSMERSGDDCDGFVNDIALIKLSTPVNYTDYVQPACIYDTPANSSVVCYSMGAGSMSNNEPTSRKLIGLPMVQDCPGVPTTWSPVGRTCWATNSNKFKGNPCQGDPGAPMYCFDKCPCKNYTKAVLSGVVSSGPPDGCKKGRVHYHYYSDTFKLRAKLRKLLTHCTV